MNGIRTSRARRLSRLSLSLLGCVTVVAVAAPVAQAGLNWNVTSKDFGSAASGVGKGSTFTFTLTATCSGGGGSPLFICTDPPGGVHNFGAPTVTGDGFSLSGTNTCIAGLLITVQTTSAPQTCQTGVRFSPNTPGLKTGSLNLPSGPDVALTGTGLGTGASGPSGGGTQGAVKKKCKKHKKRSAASAARKKCKKKKK